MVALHQLPFTPQKTDIQGKNWSETVKVTRELVRFAKEVKDGKIKRRRPAVVRDVEYDVFGV